MGHESNYSNEVTGDGVELPLRNVNYEAVAASAARVDFAVDAREREDN
uniref:Uncharacterized protein n=1 Tax=Peronospora matthiolae TaxID=2874970 RepID=A0AAV1TLP2_9STRA